ncbi:MAG TPA: TonB-dependent receptor plug domain-containing protein [Longimicrobium sp.]
MRTASRPFLLLLAALLWYPARSAAAQGSAVVFTVFAAETQAPLPGAQVSVDGRGRGVADAQGVVRVEGLSPGRHGASVTLMGRIPRGVRIDLTAGEEREVMVVMEALSVTLAPLTAAARARSRDWRIEDFYRRAQNSSTGRFITRAKIEEQNAIRFTDLFYGVPGVRVQPGPDGNTVRSTRALSMSQGGDCPPRFFVDGFPYTLSGPVDVEFGVTEIEGVEMYFGNVPAQWGGSSAMCGVILVWTRTSAAPATRS